MAKMVASPNEANASTRVISVASTTTLNAALKVKISSGYAACGAATPQVRTMRLAKHYDYSGSLQRAGSGCTALNDCTSSNMSVTLVQPLRTFIR